MTTLGVVANGRSWRNARAGMAAPPDLAGALFETPDSLEGYAGAMARFRDAGVDTVAIAGGDGTLRDVLSALIPAYGDALPAIVLLPRGKTNVAAADVGHGGDGDDAVTRLIAALRTGAAPRRAVRRPIGVATGGVTRYGFVFGAGAFERATRLVNEKVHSKGLAQRLGVAVGVAAAVGSMFSRATRAEWLNGAPASIAVDGGQVRSGDSFAILATSLQKLLLGLWPFWGQGPGAIAFTDVAAPPRRLARGLAAAARGKPRPWMRDAGYRSVRADRVALTLRDPFIFDGDTFAPGEDGRVELKAGPDVVFLAF